YLKYMRDVYDDDAHGTIGKCFQRSDGFVHIIFSKQDNQGDFERVLVHESTHGYLHRYRSPVLIPSWLNEGLAEETATDVVGLAQGMAGKWQEGRTTIQEHQGIGDEFFTAEHIEGWQYPAAETMVEFMIRQNRDGFVKFINAIKDGQDSEEALKKNMGWTYETLARDLYKTIGVVLAARPAGN